MNFWYNKVMKKQTKNILQAFTLIEILMVIAIIGIVASILFGSLSSGQAVKSVETNAREFVGVVREAQNYALTGKQLIAGTDPCGYVVGWSGANYTMTYKYKNAGGACSQSSIVTTYQLKGGATFSATGSLEFGLPHGVIVGLSSGSRAVIFAKGGTTHVACVYFNGRMLDQAGSTCP